MTKEKGHEIEQTKPDTAALSTMQSAESLIAQAIDKNVPVETMERLLAMRRELKAEWAKEQFDISMAEFQAECPVIVKDKDGATTRSGKVAYRYAPLDSIVRQTKELISRHGFSYQIKTESKNGCVSASCTARHISGHSETSTVEVPLGTKTDVMSQTQVVAAAMTYAKRYAFCDVFGILTGDEDDDAISTKQTPQKPYQNTPNTPNTPTQTSEEKQKIEIVKLCKELHTILGKDAPANADEYKVAVKVATGFELQPENYKQIIEKLSQVCAEQIKKRKNKQQDQTQKDAEEIAEIYDGEVVEDGPFKGNGRAAQIMRAAMKKGPGKS